MAPDTPEPGLLRVWRQTWAAHQLWAWATWTEALQLRAVCRDACQHLVPAAVAHTPTLRPRHWTLTALVEAARRPHLHTLVDAAGPPSSLRLEPPGVDRDSDPPYPENLPLAPTYQALEVATAACAVLRGGDPGLSLGLGGLPGLQRLWVAEDWAGLVRLHLPWPQWLAAVVDRWGPTLTDVRVPLGPGYGSGGPGAPLPRPPPQWGLAAGLTTVVLTAPLDVALWTPWLRSLATLPVLERLVWWSTPHLGSAGHLVDTVQEAWQGVTLPRVRVLDWGHLPVLGALPWATVAPTLTTLASGAPGQFPGGLPWPESLRAVHVRGWRPGSVATVGRLLLALPVSVTVVEWPEALLHPDPGLAAHPWWARAWERLHLPFGWVEGLTAPTSLSTHLRQLTLHWPTLRSSFRGVAPWVGGVQWPALEELRFTQVSGPWGQVLQQLAEARGAGRLPRCHTWAGLAVGVPLHLPTWAAVAASHHGPRDGPAPVPLTLEVDAVALGEAAPGPGLALWAGLAAVRFRYTPWSPGLLVGVKELVNTVWVSPGPAPVQAHLGTPVLQLVVESPRLSPAVATVGRLLQGLEASTSGQWRGNVVTRPSMDLAVTSVVD